MPLIQLLFRLCLFAAKPQDLPASTHLLAACALASLLGYQISNSLLSTGGVFAISLVQTALLGAALWLVVVVYKKPQRWLQSATALYGASAVTHLAALPLIVWFFDSGYPVDKFSAGALCVAAFRIWFLGITIAILKETLEVSRGQALAVAVALQLLYAVVLVMLFGNQLG